MIIDKKKKNNINSNINKIYIVNNNKIQDKLKEAKRIYLIDKKEHVNKNAQSKRIF